MSIAAPGSMFPSPFPASRTSSMPDCDAQCILLGKGTLQRLRRPNSENPHLERCTYPFRAVSLGSPRAKPLINDTNLDTNPVNSGEQPRRYRSDLTRPRTLVRSQDRPPRITCKWGDTQIRTNS